MINLYWFDEVSNLGDLLNPIIVEHVTGKTVTWVNEEHNGKLLALGSVLEFAKPNDVLWGTGSKINRIVEHTNALTVLAVRGPRTEKLLGLEEHSVPYGDPGLILPKILPIHNKKTGVCLVPHYVDFETMVPKHSSSTEIKIVDVTSKDWQESVEKIASSELVLSSSLHGLIIAEAYGTPAIWVQATDNIIGGTWKFNDYYESSNRQIEPRNWREGFDAVLKAEPAPLPAIDTSLIESALKDYYDAN